MTYRMMAWDLIHCATKLNFLHKKAEKIRDFDKNQYLKYGKNSLNTFSPRILSL